MAGFIRKEDLNDCDLQWLPHLKDCQKSFECWLPELMRHVENLFPTELDGLSIQSAWAVIEDNSGDIENAMQKLISSAGITLFGRYACHFPRNGSFCKALHGG